MKLGLFDVANWQDGMSCVCTALSAITGLPPTEVAVMNTVAASLRTQPEVFPTDPFRPVPINFWLDAIMRFGLKWTEIDMGFAETPYEQRPTISQLFTGYQPSGGVYLVVGERLVIGKEHETHVFAMFGDKFVDNYTQGKVTKIGSITVPPDFDEFRPKLVFEVTDPRCCLP